MKTAVLKIGYTNRFGDVIVAGREFIANLTSDGWRIEIPCETLHVSAEEADKRFDFYEEGKSPIALIKEKFSVPMEYWEVKDCLPENSQVNQHDKLWGKPLEGDPMLQELLVEGKTPQDCITVLLRKPVRWKYAKGGMFTGEGMSGFRDGD
jgi:hypothetical protein